MEGKKEMKKTLATILAILFLLPIYAGAFNYPKELDKEVAVKRIANAKLHFLKTGEGSDEDAPPVKVIGDYLDLKNTGVLNKHQRLIIINYN